MEGAAMRIAEEKPCRNWGKLAWMVHLLEIDVASDEKSAWPGRCAPLAGQTDPISTRW
ncbi:MAG: hypothetical protein VB137_13615 [Burkholderia sp.]